MNAMNDIRAQLAALRQQDDEWCAQHFEGWSRIQFSIARAIRPFSRRVKAVKKVAKHLYSHGQAVQSKAGVGIGRQAFQQYQAAIRCRIPPDKYYLYSLYNDPDHIDQYISTTQWGRLLETILSVQGTDVAALLDDKRASYRHFSEHGLPTLSVLAEFEDGTTVPRAWTVNTPLPKRDLFSKPIGKRQGMGARRWIFMGAGRGYRTEEGEVIGQENLLGRLEAQSRNDVILLQERARNHPKIRALTGPTLAAMRIFTMRPPGGAPEYLSGLIGLPLKDIVANNFIPEFAVIGASINDRTGRLGPAYRKKLNQVMDPIDVHPTSGVRIEGFRVPDWTDAKQLALRAHRTLRNIALVGWDIALTTDGPVIIEGNKTPGGDSFQVAHKTPWGATRFPELYIENLNGALQGASPRASIGA